MNQCAVTGGYALEVAFLLEWLSILELEGEHSVQSITDVHEYVVLGPFQAERVELLGEVGAPEEFGVIGGLVSVSLRIGSPVKGRANEITTARIGLIVSA